MLLLILTQFCSCSDRLYDIGYNGEHEYESFYLVDTIKIKDPVRIHSLKFGGQFIVSKAIINEYSKEGRKFFQKPDVFILGNDLYRDLPKEKYGVFKYQDNGGCELVKSAVVSDDLEIYEYKQNSISFLLGLINGNYYYVKHNSYDAFAFHDKNKKFNFYKIVYPLCK